MSLVRLLARPMLASAYIGNGVTRIRKPEVAAASLSPLVALAKKKVDLPLDATTVARATGVAQVTAGALLAIGRFPRFSASVLVGTYLIDVVGEQLSKEKSSGLSLATKTSLLGGALLASVDTDGRPGLAWRLEQASKEFRRELDRVQAKATGALESGVKSVEGLASK